jgi:D-3-phosphoglycerate dehydrogenase
VKIIIAEKISASAVAQLQEPGWTVLTADQLDGKLEQELESADALIVRSAVQADAKLLEHAKKLRVIGRAGVGVDNIDLDAATHKGIAVMNTPGANAVAVAEQTLGMMLAMARHLCRADALMHAGKWEKKSLQGTELRAKTLGIIGLGRSVCFGGGGEGAGDPADWARRALCSGRLYHAAPGSDSADRGDDQ